MIILIPAYGRDYKSQAAAYKDFNDGKDFQISGMGKDAGSYVTRSELAEAGETRVCIRYKSQRMKFYADVSTRKEI